MMVNKTKRENPQFQFRGFGGVQCESLFSTNFPTFSLSLSLLFSLAANEEAEEELRRTPRETRRFRRRRDFEDFFFWWW